MNNESETVKKFEQIKNMFRLTSSKQKSDVIRCSIDAYNVILLNSSIVIFYMSNIPIEENY